MTTRDFVKRQEQKLAKKYAQRSLRQVVRQHATTTKDQMDQINQAYKKFIETPIPSQE